MNLLFRKNHPIPSEMLIWGLKYTLNGKESIGTKVQYFQEVTTLPVNINKCEFIPNGLLEIYLCNRKILQ